MQKLKLFSYDVSNLRINKIINIYIIKVLSSTVQVTITFAQLEKTHDKVFHLCAKQVSTVNCIQQRQYQRPNVKYKH
jgi:hypothetical protein